MNVYEVLAVTLDERKRPVSLIFGPEVYIGETEQAAVLQATLLHSGELRSFNTSEVAIRVRPF